MFKDATDKDCEFSHVFQKNDGNFYSVLKNAKDIKERRAVEFNFQGEQRIIRTKIQTPIPASQSRYLNHYATRLNQAKSISQSDGRLDYCNK